MKEEATSDLSRVIMVCFVHLDLTEVRGKKWAQQKQSGINWLELIASTCSTTKDKIPKQLFFLEPIIELRVKKKLHFPADGTSEESNPLHSVTVRRPPPPPPPLLRLRNCRAGTRSSVGVSWWARKVLRVCQQIEARNAEPEPKRVRVEKSSDRVALDYFWETQPILARPTKNAWAAASVIQVTRGCSHPRVNARPRLKLSCFPADKFWPWTKRLEPPMRTADAPKEGR